MPIFFDDYDSLRSAAKVHHFRPPLPDEPEEVYRAALADHVQPIDLVESYEIRYKRWP